MMPVTNGFAVMPGILLRLVGANEDIFRRAGATQGMAMLLFRRPFGMVLLLASVGSALPAADSPPAPSAHALRLVGDEEVHGDGRTPPTIATPSGIDLGTRDFTLGLSVHTEERLRDDLGSLLSLWDAHTRHGFHLELANNTGCTSSQANWRQLQFGLDAGSTPAWRAEGRPGRAVLGFALCVHDGCLYVGTCETEGDGEGRVYRYVGPGHWHALPRLDGSNAVTSLASHEGRLYAATGKYRLAGSSLPESSNPQRGGRVFRLSSDDQWEPAGELPDTEAVAGLVHFDGRLYASSLYRPAGFFRHEGGRQWTSVPTPHAQRVQALTVHDGAIYASSYDGGKVYRFDGTDWTDLGLVGQDNTQTYSFAAYGGRLHVGTWPSGRVFRLDPPHTWTDTGRLGDELEVMALLVHNGSLYGGTLPLGQVYRYDAGGWTLLKRLDETPDVKYRRVWTMATYQGRLFCTTLPSGEIWSLSAGQCVTWDHEFPSGWHDVAAQRQGGRLRLFVDGRCVAESSGNDAPLALATGRLKLTVGDGPRGPFLGRLRKVWLDVAP
uniref:LamG domain-containing protein n=1 Tax=Schlesneria paludicola TaxID=360056 RepID=A0A7C4LLR8_9PLAN